MLDSLRSRWKDPIARSGARRYPTGLLWRSTIAPLLRRRMRRALIAELDGLCDHLLSDIGLARNDIPRFVDTMLASDRATAVPPMVSGPQQPLEGLQQAA